MPRGVGRGEQGAAESVVLSSPAQQRGLTALAKELLPSHSYSSPVEELPHSMGDGKTSPFHSDFHTTGLLLENLSLKSGKICPFREEVYVWHMAGDTFLQPGRHKVTIHPHSPGDV